MTSCQVVASCKVVTSCQVVTTCAAIFPSDNMAQSNGGGLWGVYPHSRLRLSPNLQCCPWTTWPRAMGGVSPIQGCDFQLICNIALGQHGPEQEWVGKVPNVGRRPVQGIIRVKPHYLADKRPVDALSASIMQKKEDCSLQSDSDPTR